VAVLFGSSVAFGYGDAGCGLGSVIFTKNGTITQLFAITTNYSSFSQSLGITTGTSNCSASGIVMNEKQIQYFVEVNQEDLSREIAQGHGEKLSTLAALHGCNDQTAVSAFAVKAQAHYQDILPNAKTNAVDMVQNMKATS